jgi:hypothetical protein
MCVLMLFLARCVLPIPVECPNRTGFPFGPVRSAFDAAEDPLISELGWYVSSACGWALRATSEQKKQVKQVVMLFIHRGSRPSCDSRVIRVSTIPFQNAE